MADAEQTTPLNVGGSGGGRSIVIGSDVSRSRPPHTASSSNSNSKDIDGGWAWVVCAACFTVNVLFNGQTASTAIYFVTFQQAFQQSRSTVSWIFGLYNATVCIAGLVVSALIRKWGPRLVMIAGSFIMSASMIACYFATSTLHLTVLFGICGVGGSCLFTSAIAAPAIYFKKRLYVATGISISGAGMGILVVGPLLEWTLDMYGWRGAILLQGGLMLQGVVCGALLYTPRLTKLKNQLLKDQTDEKGVAKVETPRPSSSRVLLKDLRTWLIVVCMFLHFVIFTSFLVCLKDFVVQERAIGISFSVVAIVVGASNTVARLISGFFAKVILPSILFSIASLLAAASIAVMVFVEGDWVIVVAVVLVNFGFGLQAVMMNLMTASIFGGRDMATVFSYGLFAAVFGTLGAPSVIGYLKDSAGTYTIPFVLMVVGFTVAGLSSLMAYYVHRQVLIKKKKQMIMCELARI